MYFWLLSETICNKTLQVISFAWNYLIKINDDFPDENQKFCGALETGLLTLKIAKRSLYSSEPYVYVRLYFSTNSLNKLSSLLASPLSEYPCKGHSRRRNKPNAVCAPPNAMAATRVNSLPIPLLYRRILKARWASTKGKRVTQTTSS